MLWSINHLQDVSLDFPVAVCLSLGSLELAIVLQQWPHLCWWEAKDHLPQLLAILILMQPRIPPSFLATRAQCHLTFNLVSHPDQQGFFVLLLFISLLPSYTRCMRLFAFSFVEINEAPVCLFLQLVEFPLNGNTTHCLWFYIISKLAEATLYPIIHTIKDVEHDWTQHCPWETHWLEASKQTSCCWCTVCTHSFSQFSIHFTAFSSSPYSPVTLRKFYKRYCQKPYSQGRQYPLPVSHPTN